MSEEVKATSPIAPSTGGTLQSQQNVDPQEQFTAAVDDLLDQLQHKFDNVSREIFGKLDDMARRLDELETSLTISGDATTTTPTTTTPTK